MIPEEVGRLPADVVEQICPRPGMWGVFPPQRLMYRGRLGVQMVGWLATHEIAVQVADGLNRRRRLAEVTALLLAELDKTLVNPDVAAIVAVVRDRLEEENL